jgi:hypothetical protein
MGRLVYRPLALAGGVVAGALAAQAFHLVWKQVPIGGDHVPSPYDPEFPLRDVVVAAAMQAVIFAGVKVAVDRGSARAFQSLTGTWPV